MKIPFILILLSTLVHAQTAAYILCEGNFMVGNSTLWKISNQSEISGINENPIGDTGQSLTKDGNRLFSIMNGTGTIEVFDILESGDLDFVTSISTNFSGPREMVVLNGKGFVTEWYTNSIAILDLESLTFIGSIPVQGLPEDILTDGEQLFVSITMNSDWSNANTVVVIDPVSGLIINEFVVASGPGQMLLENDHLFISHIYYDDNW
ncbi:MAG: YncE family protein, partial [Fidelibacterota bacterium]